MAELPSQAAHSRSAGKRHGKKLSTRVDLTPMVDLGFLLITFFIVTTTWSRPHALNLFMPAKGDSSNIGQNSALTVVALKDNKVFYYNGDLRQSLKEGTFGITGYAPNGGIGDIIRQKQSAMDRFYKGGRKELMLIIKPSRDANYKNVVNLLDETLINQIGRYAMEDISDAEMKQLPEEK
jgi:Biopolymer transport protein ExbD/TolR